MNLDEKEDYFERNFGYVKVEWEITNYFIETCKKNWVIHSPPFSVTGCQVTKWRLCFKGKREEKNIFAAIYLERLDSDRTIKTAHVNWKLVYPCGLYIHYISETTSKFEKKSIKCMEICKFEELEMKMHSISCTTFEVQCRMFVYNTDCNAFPKSKDPGLKPLSQDLAVLYRLKQYFDITVNIDGLLIEAHKAVLFSRSKILGAEKNINTLEIDLPDLDCKATNSIFGYLYTGNLDYVLKMPSFEVKECITYFNIKELESYFTHDELTLCTQISFNEYCFNWIIHNAESLTEDCITSSLFKEKITNMYFKLYLYQKGFNGNGKNMSISIELAGRNMPNYLCAEFSVMDSRGKRQYLKRIRWALEDGKKQDLEDFAPSDILVSDYFVQSGMLNILCSVSVPVDSQNLKVVKSKTHYNKHPKCEYFYDLLSDQMMYLFETGKFSDYTIICGETSFRVHIFILKARSHKFKTIINLSGNEESVKITDIEPRILHQVLSYIYSGRLKNYQLSDITKIYVAAERFFILPLKYACSSILQDHIEMQNVIEIINLAEEFKDFKLKRLVSMFVFKNFE